MTIAGPKENSAAATVTTEDRINLTLDRLDFLTESSADSENMSASPGNGKDAPRSTTSECTWRQGIRYRFDNFMAKGGSSIFLSLVIIFVGLLLGISLVRGIMLWAAPAAALERGGGFFHNMYVTFLQMTDPGNMNQDVDSSPLFKFAAVISGLIGVIMLSTLVAFITTALDQKLSQLKKGHSKVIESEHTLILGWNERVLEVIRELVLANESEDDPAVVILAGEDKEMMDDHLKLNMADTQNTRVVTRSGSPSSLVNLEIASVNSSRSVIVLARCAVSATAREREASDAVVIKTVLALIAARPSDIRLNIVAEIFLDRNRKIVEDISPEEVSTVDTDEILAKMLVQTSRSTGLSVVYGEILSFDGCEMYFHEDDWAGISFGDLGYHFPDGIPMGIRHADGEIVINPSIETVMKEDDSILILAEDDSTIDFRPKPIAKHNGVQLEGHRMQPETERNLIIGWTSKVETIIREYADYCLEGSNIGVMLRQPDDTVRAQLDALNEELDSVSIELIAGNPLTKEGLADVEPFNYDNIIILSQGQAGDENDERTESETIVILLLLRKMLEDHPDAHTKLITEVLDSENQPLIAKAGVHDFIISNRFISMVLAQISEDSDIRHVYDDLFDEDGSEIYVKPANLYFDNFPVQLTYADMIHIAQQREEICLGVKLKSLENDASQNFGVKLIPEKHVSYTLNAEDSLVVLAEDDT